MVGAFEGGTVGAFEGDNKVGAIVSLHFTKVAQLHTPPFPAAPSYNVPVGQTFEVAMTPF